MLTIILTSKLLRRFSGESSKSYARASLQTSSHSHFEADAHFVVAGTEVVSTYAPNALRFGASIIEVLR